MTHLYKHERKRVGEHELVVPLIRRNYIFRAFVDARTGRHLKRVTGGCRNWVDFDHARQHYRGETNSGRGWSESEIERKLQTQYGPGMHDSGNVATLLASDLFKSFLNRQEARDALRLLGRKVNAYRDKRYRINTRNRIAALRATLAKKRRAA